MVCELSDGSHINEVIEQLEPADLSFMLAFIEVFRWSPPERDRFQDSGFKILDYYCEYINL